MVVRQDRDWWCTPEGGGMARARAVQPSLFEISAEDRGLVEAAASVAQPLHLVDLFAGAGGLSEGFSQQGFTIVAGSDIDPDACATYALNFPQARTICGDIREPDVHQQVIAAGRGADVVVGGPPCQAFSQMRNHSRIIDDPRNSLYREFVKTVAELSPAAFVMENVPGMAQMGVVEQVKEDLELSGEYRVRPQVVDAADFGVPQTRKRIVFLGIRRGFGVDPPEITGTDATSYLALARRAKGKYGIEGRGNEADRLLEALGDDDDLNVVSTAQAISDLRKLETGRRKEDIPLDDLPEPESAYQRVMRKSLGETLGNVSVPRINQDTVTRLRGIPPGGNHRDLDDALTARYISGQRWGPSTDSGRLGRAHFYAYRRLHPGIWAWTLNTKADCAYHYEHARALSVREFARLQSFPDHFVFTTDPRSGLLPGRIDGGAAHSRYRQAGNAVPPLLAAAIAREVAAVVYKARAKNQGSP
jgi:DNA (cytosine-5)-methyltransferase 1